MLIELEPLSVSELALRLGLAAVLGSVVGMNRNLHGKPAGLKTHALVALGAAMVVIIGMRLECGPAGALAPGQMVEYNALSRIIQGVLQGIGFLGAGVILHSESGKRVHGLTSAASIWISAAIGLACGVGVWRTVSVAFVVAFLILAFGSSTEKWIHRVFGGSDDDESPS